VYSVAFSPSGRTLATGDAAGEVVLYDLTSAKTTTLNDGSPVDSLAFSPNSKSLASGDDGGLVNRYRSFLWNSSFARLKRSLCQEVAGSNMTRSQWTSYVPDQTYQKTCS
jgi:WD40 repeat protein